MAHNSSGRGRGAQWITMGEGHLSCHLLVSEDSNGHSLPSWHCGLTSGPRRNCANIVFSLDLFDILDYRLLIYNFKRPFQLHVCDYDYAFQVFRKLELIFVLK